MAVTMAEISKLRKLTGAGMMDYMRNELNIVILYDRSAKTYYYSNKGLYDSLKQWIA